ncbi:MAG TPA: potassium-transporting ATPase subunit KdpA, partial [Mycobacterium sp.]|nr:potassium-transporting ATPase subunit KdpA [Mycobacterium sp.]
MFEDWVQIAILAAVVIALTPPLGAYMARVYTGERVMLERVLGPLERLFYRAFRVDPSDGQDWKRYARSLLLFSLVGWLAMYAILRSQSIQPWNSFPGVDFHSAPWNVTFNTVSSFVSNTNWQYYGGESTLTYLSQMLGMTVQNFVSAAAGIAVLIALIRGIIARSGKSLGNFWRDLVRTSLYVLLPLSVIGTLLLVSQGVIQNL